MLVERADAIERLVWEGLVWDGVAWWGPSPLGWSGGWAPGEVDDGFGARDDPAHVALVEWLASGPRGEIVAELAAPGDDDWASMVGGGTRWEGNRAVRFLDIEPDPGAGIIVVDFFIPGDGSFFLDGDRRPHADPIFGELTTGDSRAAMVFDREVGRASIQFDGTCPMYVPGCQAARAITLGGEPVAIGARGLPEIANQVRVDSGPGQLTLDFDILNGIFPIGSVDGTMTVRNTGDGSYEVASIEADEYPSVGVY